MIDKIYILKLQNNDTSVLEKTIHETFPSIGIRYFEVEKKQNESNEGKMELSLWDIMKHDRVDAVAKDIAKNHIHMVMDAYQQKYKTVLIVEEDAIIEKNNHWPDAQKWLGANEWDIFYLGYCNWPVLCSFFITPHIVKLYTPLLAHAYLLNKQGMEKILNYTEKGHKNMDQHIDKMYTRIPSFHKFGMYPMMVHQTKNAALFTKACDKMNINVSMTSLCKINQSLSLCIPIIVIILFVIILLRYFVL